VSYHLLYPLLFSKTKFLHLAIFPSCRSRWRMEQGTAAVYSRNQLFRLPLNFKLPDETSTPLRLPGSCAVSDFRNACVTCGTGLDNEAWRMPDGDDSRNTRPDYISARSDLLVPMRHYQSIYDPERAVGESVRALLLQAGQPEGRLQLFSNG
jgi:hypothetical protein